MLPADRIPSHLLNEPILIFLPLYILLSAMLTLLFFAVPIPVQAAL